jgi:hypothetical protein
VKNNLLRLRWLLAWSVIIIAVTVIASIPLRATAILHQSLSSQTHSGTWHLSTRSDFATGTLAGLALIGEPDAALVLLPDRAQGDFISSAQPADFRFMAVGVQWQGDLPPGSDVRLWLRTSDDGQTWLDWIKVPAADMQRGTPSDHWSELVFATGQWLQVKAELTGDGLNAISLDELTVVYIDTTAGPTAVEARRYAEPSAPAGTPAVISRAGWGADESYRFSDGEEIWPPEYRPPQIFIVHHTVTDNNSPNPAAQVRAIYYYHAVTLGWGDIGYNFLVDSQGRIYEGRYGGEDEGQTVVGGHALQYNYGSVGIALLGNYQEADPTELMVSGLVDLIAWKASRFNIDPLGSSFFIDDTYPNIAGHRDLMNTTCPGNHAYAELPLIRQRVADQIQQEPSCDDLVANGGFEVAGNWELSHAYRSSYMPPPEGQWAVLIGLLDSEADTPIWSQAVQALTVPEIIDQAILSFWTYTVSSDLAGDQQTVAVLDENGQLLAQPMLYTPAANSRAWEFHQYELSAILQGQQGKTIYLQLAVYNDGDGQGKTYMRVDDVALTVCRGTGNIPTVTPSATRSPTATPTSSPTATVAFTPTPTATPTRTVVPSPTATPCSNGPCPSPTPAVCTELLANSGFESSDGWIVGTTTSTARYSNEQTHSGAMAMLLGIIDPQDDSFSYSSVWQDISIPSTAMSAVLSFWYCPISHDPADRQIAEIQIPSEGSLNRLMGADPASNSQNWEYASFDLTEHYIGRDVRLYFGVVNQSNEGVSAMFLDDVSLRVCRPLAITDQIYLPLMRKDKIEWPN